MMSLKTNINNQQLKDLCTTVKKYAAACDYQECLMMILKAMSAYPDAPQPHNLYGVLLEKRGDHVGAMKHFRAAYALDPTYLPARYNLELYGTLSTFGRCAFDESDCPAAYLLENEEREVE